MSHLAPVPGKANPVCAGSCTCDPVALDYRPTIKKWVRESLPSCFEPLKMSKQEVLVKWRHKPKNVLLFRRPGDEELIPIVEELAEVLRRHGARLLEVDDPVAPSIMAPPAPHVPLHPVAHLLQTHAAPPTAEPVATSPPSSSPPPPPPSPAIVVGHLAQEQLGCCMGEIDLIVVLGGDGTFLHASMLFPNRIPPIIAFRAGSLGFLTPFPMDDPPAVMEQFLMSSRFAVVMRRRLQATLLTPEKHVRLERAVLNEVTVHNSRPGLGTLQLCVDGRSATTVFADGLIVSTASGSTAYNASAGGPMAHPSLSAMVITPIAPHSLSFRPLVLPDASITNITVPPESRTHAALCFDGRAEVPFLSGESIRITRAAHAVPTICASSSFGDWMEALERCFLFNQRPVQRPLQFRERPGTPSSTTSSPSISAEGDPLHAMPPPPPLHVSPPQQVPQHQQGQHTSPDDHGPVMPHQLSTPPLYVVGMLAHPDAGEAALPQPVALPPLSPLPILRPVATVPIREEVHFLEARVAPALFPSPPQPLPPSSPPPRLRQLLCGSSTPHAPRDAGSQGPPPDLG
ncbi:putative NAD kinase [Paratrimastix pyriformis]|uniref:NAD kinase n=1 Tax=Paratrimastix pyriformis TaxID=342808 RepID=A0ABQ8UEG8_9EUKA|nr:putative NAD kinase [Paratrimastix pyriformis]